MILLFRKLGSQRFLTDYGYWTHSNFHSGRGHLFGYELRTSVFDTFIYTQLNFMIEIPLSIYNIIYYVKELKKYNSKSNYHRKLTVDKYFTGGNGKILRIMTLRTEYEYMSLYSVVTFVFVFVGYSKVLL